MPRTSNLVRRLITTLLLGCGLVAGFDCRGEATEVPRTATEGSDEGRQLFREQVRPILEKHCLECHRGEAAKGEFDLSTRDTALDSGMLGESSVDSQLLAVVSHLSEPHMPLKRDKLPESMIATLARWLDLGAPYDGPLASRDNLAGEPTVIGEAERAFWSFQPLQSTDIPETRDRAWPRTTIDRFVLHRLETSDLAPNPTADRRILIRRAYLDLHGIPPTPSEITAFLQDPAPNAYERLIDRLLAHPRYGERWARHWLDVARFAESGGFEHDSDRPQAFHYRDFIIRAFNSDMPFDQFVQWQLAGDELAPEDPLALMATGFLVAGVFPSQITESEFERTRYDQLDDMIATSGVAFLGLTIGCARCHDHKFDPIPTEDYYRFAANFTATAPAIVETDWSQHAELRPPGAAETINKLWIASEGLPHIEHHANGRGYPHVYPTTNLLPRGDVALKGDPVAPGFLRVLMPADRRAEDWYAQPPKGWRTTCNRRALADWLTDTEHGAGHLAARVIVNRLWQHHMGRGIVRTPNDFGMQGDRPSHPQLLDWLAGELIGQQWRLKPLHRMIMLSQVYMQTSSHMNTAATIDPDNVLLWRHAYQRMDAEVVRDAILSVCGTLDPTMYGPGSLDPDSRRRSVYFTVKRSHMMTSLQLFDMPEPLVSIGSRERTTIAPQALMLLNSQQVRSAAERLARSLSPHATVDDNASWYSLIDQACFTILGRPATDGEREIHAELLQREFDGYRKAGQPESEVMAVTNFCQLLLSLNEFIYQE